MFDPNNRGRYTKEFKLDALNLAQSPGYTAALAAKSLGIPAKRIYCWRKELADLGSLAFPGNGKEALSEESKRNRELERRNKDLEMDNAILKKALGIFSRAQK